MEPYKEKLSILPDHMHDAIVAWIEQARPTGSFLRALLSNNLMDAFGQADEANTAAMRQWVIYLYNYAPAGCFGSPEKVRSWIERGGLHGRKTEPAEAEMDA